MQRVRLAFYWPGARYHFAPVPPVHREMSDLQRDHDAIETSSAMQTRQASAKSIGRSEYFLSRRASRSAHLLSSKETRTDPEVTTSSTLFAPAHNKPGGHKLP